MMNGNLKNKTVILLTIDALRADHLKSYGYHRNTAPHLERFVNQGSIFLNAISNGPETPSSFSSIFTSKLPFSDGGYSPLPLNKTTFPQILKEEGIFTYGIHSNPHLGAFFNYDRGFEIFLDGERYKLEFHKPKEMTFKNLLSLNIKKLFNYRNFSRKITYRLRGFNNIKHWMRSKFSFLTEIFLPFLSIAYDARYIIKRVTTFIQAHQGPLFLWAHFMDIHSPFNPPSKNVLNFRKSDIKYSEREYLNEYVRIKPEEYKATNQLINDLKDLYDGGINFLDESLAKLIKFIKEKYKKDCLIIITADHGESFYEHGYFHHTGSIFDENLKVPLYVIDLDEKTQVEKINTMVQLRDIPATILEYFGIKKPKDIQGKSLLPLIYGDSDQGENYVISECFQKDGRIKRDHKEGFILISIRSRKWKYIYDEEKNLEYFFDILIDPLEKNNLISNNPEELTKFRELKDYHLLNVKDSEEKLKIIKSVSSINLSRNKIYENKRK